MKLRLQHIPAIRTRILTEGLNKLHETLRNSPLHNKYCIAFGALLGWAREGALLKHDSDIDFLFWREDRDALETGIDMLLDAGFKYKCCWRNTQNEVTEQCLAWRGLRFEFFEASKVAGKVQFYAYGKDRRGGQLFELLHEIPDFELAEFEFLGNTWQKPADHEKFLTAVYGDWQTPNTKYSYVRDGEAIILRTPIAGISQYRPEYK